jgi:hypothetical protein
MRNNRYLNASQSPINEALGTSRVGAGQRVSGTVERHRLHFRSADVAKSLGASAERA